MKNTSIRNVRNRTFRRNHPETGDRRVRKTRNSLHEALIGLAHEKPYTAIGVHEILERADVGRSTFYAHFRDKGELLESGIEAVIRSLDARRQADPIERILGFSLPLLEHIGRHRQFTNSDMPSNSRAVMHDRLRTVLANLIAEQVDAMTTRGTHRVCTMPTDLVAQHVAGTFVLVLNWWLGSEAALTPAEADARFRVLVLPTLAKMTS